ncbi:MAG: hypothetical protein K2M94_02510 [Paramuribaculum sp.]|nr:hypothetical protein [Paramuribaculum sp.]
MQSESYQDMEQRYAYLDIAISFKGADGVPVHKSFNGAPIVSLPSLRDIATHFVALDEGYMMWQGSGKRNLMFFVLTPGHDGASLLVNVRMDADIQVEGGSVINLFGAVRTRIAAGGELTDGVIEGLIAQSGFSVTPRHCSDAYKVNDSARSICCRSYSSRTELSDILSYPDQPAYMDYKAVLVYPADARLQPDSTLPVITTPLDRNVCAAEPDVENQSVVLCLDFGDDRVIEVPLDMEKNGDEYQNLRGGCFHGFHARGVLGRRGETFNVDLHTQVEMPAPPVTAVSLVAAAETTVTVVETESEEESVETDVAEEYVEDGNNRKWLSITLRWLLVALVAAGLIWLGWFLIKEYKSGSEAKSDESTQSMIEQAPEGVALEVADVQPVPVETAVAEEPLAVVDTAAVKKDAAYLNSTNRWERAKLSTSLYGALIDALAAGDIEVVASHDYFATVGRATNKTALLVMELLWKAKNTPNEASNVKALKNMGITDKVDLYQVMKAIERYQPVEPNTAPRPKK